MSRDWTTLTWAGRARRTVLTLGLALTVACGMAGSAAAFEDKPFGITSFSFEPTERTVTRGNEEDFEYENIPYKVPFTQAGGHPWGLTVKASFTASESQTNGEKVTVPTREARDIVTSLPAGLLGNPMAVPQCPLSVVTGSTNGEQCPGDTQVGVWETHDLGGRELLAPIVNVTPEPGQSAEFALENTVKVDTPLLTGHLVRLPSGEYGFTVVSNSVPQIAIQQFELTFWGVPADSSHDPMRGRFCSRPQQTSPMRCGFAGGEHSGFAHIPFLMWPTDCSTGSESVVLRADSWEEPGSVREGRYNGYVEKTATLPGVTGCNLLRFEPSIEVQPDTLTADEPVALGVSLNVPQPETPGSFATPHLRDAVVTLPEGMSISPGIVDGIKACDESGPEGINFTGTESEEVGLSGELQLAPGKCPAASTVGSAEAITPLLPEPVKGHVYLARPLCGGSGQPVCTYQDALDGHLYQLYLELGGEGSLGDAGINIKAHGFVEANPATGQITTEFLDNPQTPFSHLHIHLNGGARAPIDNPEACGPAVTSADFTPWSAPGITPEGVFMAGTPDASVLSPPFDVQGCSNPVPFNPGFVAGTVSPQAGQFSAFTVNIARADREQFIKGIQVHTPPGLLGMLSSVPLCPEHQADDPAVYGECTASKIGTTRVASGAGSHPFEIEGNVYLTGPYEGAPFGLSIVTHAVAGPFNLGLVVVRARIAVDPHTSELTVTTDETGPYALPQIIFGVPLRLKRVTVNIDRPGFMFNPTSCTQKQIVAVLSGSQEATSTISSPFAAAACRTLAFKPAFKASTSGHTGRIKGASLDVRLSYPKDALGQDANIAQVKVSLPKQLPSYLPTLQKACLAHTFETDPAACPPGSIVGIAKASTPLLPVGLSGPVYFISHGGEEFPSLVIVLQGYGVRVDLTGSTFIRKGITSSTFKAVPDVPVGSFELYLPESKNHALAANGNLCKSQSRLIMPTVLTAQNGMQIRQNTKITVTGCKTAHKKRNGKRQARSGK